MLNPLLIKDEAGLERVCRTLKEQSELGIDTESDGFYSYRDKVCLIQVSTRKEDYIIDTVRLPSINGLREIFRDRRILKVLHASQNDIPQLKRDFGFEVRGIFDTAQALRLLGEKQVGLASVLKSRFGVELNKKFQRYHWGRRPISEEAISYAAADSHYLLPLKDQLLEGLKEKGLEAEAREHFKELELTEPVERKFDPEGFWRIKGAADLDPKGLAVLKALYLFRERLARKKDLPPFRVMPNQALFNIAKTKPGSLAALARLRHIPKTFKGPRGRGLLKVVREAANSEPPKRANSNARGHRPSGAVLSALKSWRKEEATKRGMDSDLIIAVNTLDEIAQRSPTDLESLARVPGMGPCRMKRYGSAIIDLVSEKLEARELARKRRSRRKKRRSGRRGRGRKQ